MDSLEQLKTVGICGIVIIVMYALYNGMDGVLMSGALALIAGIVGFEFGKQKGKEKQTQDSETEA